MKDFRVKKEVQLAELLFFYISKYTNLNLLKNKLEIFLIITKHYMVINLYHVYIPLT